MSTGRLALVVGRELLPLTADEAAALHDAVLARTRRLNVILDSGGIPEDDARDHRLRTEASALARVRHMLNVGRFPVFDIPPAARWRQRSAHRMRKAVAREDRDELEAGARVACVACGSRRARSSRSGRPQLRDWRAVIDDEFTV
jgi:hypothetical protein